MLGATKRYSFPRGRHGSITGCFLQVAVIYECLSCWSIRLCGFFLTRWCAATPLPISPCDLVPRWVSVRVITKPGSRGRVVCASAASERSTESPWRNGERRLLPPADGSQQAEPPPPADPKSIAHSLAAAASARDASPNWPPSSPAVVHTAVVELRGVVVPPSFSVLVLAFVFPRLCHVLAFLED